MSSISYPGLISDIADAYRAASNTSDRVKCGELAVKIGELSTSELIKCGADGIVPDILISDFMVPLVSVMFDISTAVPLLTGTVDGAAAPGSTLGLQCADFNLAKTTKQWQHSAGVIYNEDMIVSAAGTTLCILAGRRYVKSFNGDAIVGYMFNSGGYSGPLLASTVSADAVVYDGGGGNLYASGTLEHNGQTYWYGSGGYWMGGNQTDTSGLNRYKIPEKTSIENGVKMLIDIAANENWTDIDGATGATYTVDVSTGKIRCAVTGTDDLTGTAYSNNAEII